MGRLDGKIVIITGAAAGIGLASAQRLKAEGAKLMLVDVQASALDAAAAAIGSDHCIAQLADVCDPEQVESYVEETIKTYGRIDGFFNNAGIEGEVATVADYQVDVFDQVMAVNVRGVWLGLKYVIPHMMSTGGGSIVCTSSLGGLKGAARMSAYIASKHAVVGLMRSAALEYAAHNIRINTINPAPIATRMIESIEQGFAPGAPEKIAERMAASVPLRRYGTPSEVAQLVLFLLSDESSYCTGTTFPIDGGMSAS